MKKFLSVFLLTTQAALAASAPGAAQSHAEIRDQVTAFVQMQTQSMPGKVSIKVEDVDARINLPACPNLDIFLPSGGQLAGKTSIGVRCPTSGWSLFVPVQIKVSQTMLIASHPLQQGQTLSAADLGSQTGEISQTGILTDPQQAIGKVMKQSISAGQILKQDMLRAAYTVQQGQRVKVIVKGAGFSVATDGQAINSAAEGQLVQVRTASGQIISGNANADGNVEVRY